MTTVTDKPIQVPPVRVFFSDEDRRAILASIDQVLASGMVAGGKNVQQLEEFWAKYTRSEQAVACANGGAALELIMRSLGVAGRDVLVPTNTFLATASAVIVAGGNPIFLDLDPRSFGVSLEEIKAKLTPSTAGVVVVHIGGIMTAEMPAIAKWCAAQGLWLVEDAAHAHGSEVDGKRAGQFGIAAAYSFFATKTMTCGEGGMVVTSDPELARSCRQLRDYGKRSPWESFHEKLSGNYRMSEFSAVIGLNQSLRLDEYVENRGMVANRFTGALAEVIQLVLPTERSSWYKYIAVLPVGVDRQRFKNELKQRGVSVSGGVYDIPLHLQPVFMGRGLAGSLPLAESYCARHVCLPIFYGMTDAQIEQVIATVTAVCRLPETAA